MGIETGNDRLARLHMPNKALPLKIGLDGSWQEIVMRGTAAMNENYWRPAFTVQVGQAGETAEDNWDTVALINRMSNSTLRDGRPFEFTVTPMQNVPLGHLKSRSFASLKLDESQLAVYHAAYKHLAKEAMRSGCGASGEPNKMVKLATAYLISAGAWAMFQVVSTVCRRRRLDLERAGRHGVEQQGGIMTLVRA